MILWIFIRCKNLQANSAWNLFPPNGQDHRLLFRCKNLQVNSAWNLFPPNGQDHRLLLLLLHTEINQIFSLQKTKGRALCKIETEEFINMQAASQENQPI